MQKHANKVAKELVKIAKSLTGLISKDEWVAHYENWIDSIQSMAEARGVLLAMEEDKEIADSDKKSLIRRIKSRGFTITAGFSKIASFEVGDFVMQKARDEENDIYALVIGELLDGGSKVVAIAANRGIAAIQSTKNWYPSPVKIRREDVPPNMLVRIERKAQGYMPVTAELANPLDGMSNVKARKVVFNLLHPYSKGFFTDDAWLPVNAMWKAMSDSGMDWNTISADYDHNSSGIPSSKRWKFDVRFTNDNGRPTILRGTVVASGAGSVSDPLNRYDLVVMVY